MSASYRCSRGHAWDAPVGGGRARCPVCGEVVAPADSRTSVIEAPGTIQAASPEGLRPVPARFDSLPEFTSSDDSFTPILEATPPPLSQTEEIEATVAPSSRPSTPPSSGTGATHLETVSLDPAARARVHDAHASDTSPDEHTTLTVTPRYVSGPETTGLAPPHYEVLGELGRGGMGVVYHARDRRLNRDVALKMMLAAGYASHDELDRFKAEAEAIARLEHPAVVRIYEIGEFAGRPFLALEYCNGGSLNKKIAGEPQPPISAAAMVSQLARGMAAAHARGVVHRDLKPGNVLLTDSGEPKITDFGLAKRIDEESSRTNTGAILGTPSYMAPEQARGESKQVGPPADIYALGAILYDLLTGRPPFKGESAMDTAIQVVQSEVIPPSRLLPKLPPDLETITLKCLQKDPAKRYPSAAELADDIDRFLDGRPILARPVGTAERAWKWAKRRPAIAALLAMLAFTLTGGFAAVTVLWLQAVAARNAADVEKKEADRQRDIADAERNKAEERQKEALREAERAEMEKTRAEGEQKRAEEEKEKAQREHAAAVAQKKRADKFFADAQQVIEALTHVGQVDLADTPGAQAVRRKVLNQALGFFEDLSDEEADDPVLRGQVARAALLVADLHESLGDHAKARAAYSQAAALYAALPDSPAARAGRAACDNNLAILLQSTGGRQDRVEAEKLYARAVAAKESLARDFPADPDYRRSLAQGYNNLATFWQIARDRAKAGDYFQKAIAVLTDLAKSPGRPDDLRELALTLVNWGTFLQSGGDAAGAADAYGRAEIVQRKLVAQSNAPAHRKELARTLLNSGTLLQQADDKSKEAVAKYDAAAELLDGLTRDFPLAVEYRTELAVALRNRAMLHRRQRMADAADEDYKRAASLLAPLAGEGRAVAPKLEYVRTLAERAQLAAAAGAAEAEATWMKAITSAEVYALTAPKETAFAREHARLVGNLGLYLAGRGPDRAADAESRLRQAITEFGRIEKAAAGDADVVDRCAADRAYFAAALANVLADRGDAAAAAEAWKQVFASLDELAGRAGYGHAGRVVGHLATAGGQDWPHAATAAELAARCAGRAAADEALSDTLRKQLADAYAAVALDLLRKLKAAGKLDEKWLKSSDALAPLRERPDFRAEFLK